MDPSMVFDAFVHVGQVMTKSLRRLEQDAMADADRLRQEANHCAMQHYQSCHDQLYTSFEQTDV
jgi:hypothetical protein